MSGKARKDNVRAGESGREVKMEMKLNDSKTTRSYRLIDIKWDTSFLMGVGFWKRLWGTDIWIQNIPCVKVMALANILMWVALWLTR